jgi:hypothetical protein
MYIQLDTELSADIRRILSSYNEYEDEIVRINRIMEGLRQKMFTKFCEALQQDHVDKRTITKLLNLDVDTFNTMVNSYYGNNRNLDILGVTFSEALKLAAIPD